MQLIKNAYVKITLSAIYLLYNKKSKHSLPSLNLLHELFQRLLQLSVLRLEYFP